MTRMSAKRRGARSVCPPEAPFVEVDNKPRCIIEERPNQAINQTTSRIPSAGHSSSICSVRGKVCSSGQHITGASSPACADAILAEGYINHKIEINRCTIFQSPPTFSMWLWSCWWCPSPTCSIFSLILCMNFLTPDMSLSFCAQQTWWVSMHFTSSFLRADVCRSQ